ncbi:MAG TPA: hypothetical protein VMA73_03610 [Streptosporangiaceae bacterium]|nr:hypothetical protein [Streptosporangiaceae bacterium]
MKTWFAAGSPAAVTVACVALLAGVSVALLAGKDDIRRFWQIHNM